MRSMNLVASIVFASLAVAAVQIGCSSDNTISSPQLTPFDSGVPSVPSAAPGVGPVTINITGTGTVASEDAIQTDGGFNGAVVCTATGGAKCSAAQNVVVVAIPGNGFTFQAWTAAGGVVVSNNDSITVSPGTPTPLTALFVATTAGGGATPPKDAGGGG